MNALNLDKLADRLAEADEIVDLNWPGALEVKQISYDSREVEPGCLFFCKGAHFDPKFLDQAKAKGAVAYIAEDHYPQVDLPYCQVRDVRRAMPLVADAFYGAPYQAFDLIGITGTKGKTTTTAYLHAILDAYQEDQGKPATAFLSSNRFDDGIDRGASQLTTPESLPLFKHFDHARQSQRDFMIMEVSSQALKYRRVDQVVFDVAAFLNISRDHISPNEHPNFEDYFESKLKIFDRAKCAVLAKDSDHYDRILDRAQRSPEVEEIITVSLNDASADYYATDIQAQTDGQRFTLHDPEGQEEMTMSMQGIFNVENALVAIAIARHYGVPYALINQALAQIKAPGRMEVFQSADGQLKAIVDFAHNLLSFEQLFHAAKQMFPDHRYRIVFGAPGNRGIGRREDLPQVAAQEADAIYLTMDDPDTESVEAICQTLHQHVLEAGGQAEIILDRPQAIHQAFVDAAADQAPNVVLLAGKGDECFMKINGNKEDYLGDVHYAQAELKAYDKAQSASK
ncbi:UDP-N-acetylmuramoyl-L-alanyl-D-glutamate--2,6-diaminopimelate ligase [Aerococcus sp. UMB7834]|uniref:Mur ligase family protein n=1 Tax=Aerococcus sp. UMB7834 TaxID=3046342 RepID=UPI00254A8C80|nr:UDP-N-acetylmuramoyl-L-alanyl-D-glutamate--2,6-diaminopimelate ligase [Aerococcus sp. UMB7834]MDK6805174.1 UDP-N-acetylmuramoyl-L-alanyl-D-glutamate--2,6-diaminopimelate ligase [Aerococcus sp. UMB7834]